WRDFLRGSDTANFYLSGATANTNFIESADVGNPTDYKTFAWGIDDACPSKFNYERYFFGRKPQFWVFNGLVKGLPRVAADFRPLAPINTYAETAPNVDIEHLRRQFQIGVDRQLARTAPES